MQENTEERIGVEEIGDKAKRLKEINESSMDALQMFFETFEEKMGKSLSDKVMQEDFINHFFAVQAKLQEAQNLSNVLAEQAVQLDSTVERFKVERLNIQKKLGIPWGHMTMVE